MAFPFDTYVLKAPQISEPSIGPERYWVFGNKMHLVFQRIFTLCKIDCYQNVELIFFTDDFRVKLRF